MIEYLFVYKFQSNQNAGGSCLNTFTVIIDSMQTITLVTGNSNKAHEYETLLSTTSSTTFVTRKIDIAEIQSLDLEVIVRDKLYRAYDMIQAPVVIEDVAAGLASLNGLPGPFIKFFEEKLGASALHILAKQPDERVTILCIAGYYDGERILVGVGELRGTIVAPRGENGFGFDSVIVPDGENQTMAEMSEEKKNSISHRAKAVEALLKQLGVLR